MDSINVKRAGMRHYLPVWAGLAALLALENAGLLRLEAYFDYRVLYAVKILLWLLLAGLVRSFPAGTPSGLTRLRKTVTGLAFIFSFFHVLCYIILGLFTAFGKNTYSQTPAAIALNIVFLAASLAGGEMCRAFLINGKNGRHQFMTAVLVSVTLAVMQIPLAGIGRLEGHIDVLNFITGTVFPELTLSVAASCLAYLSGAAASASYLGAIRAFGFLSPFIPDPDIISRLLFNILTPMISVYAITKIYLTEAFGYDRSIHRRRNAGAGWVATCALSVAIVWFSVGVFPIYPSVILTGSMEPEIMPGDVILAQKTESGNVEVGDIIMFNNGEGLYITHRVIEKTDDTGEILFVTKGDNNQCADAGAVNSSQLKGKVIAILPDAGKLTLYLRGGEA